MKTFEIWIEGYSVTGNQSNARKIGEIVAETFQQACDMFCDTVEFQQKHGKYDRNRLTVWGCRLFDDESDARKSFG